MKKSRTFSSGNIAGFCSKGTVKWWPVSISWSIRFLKSNRKTIMHGAIAHGSWLKLRITPNSFSLREWCCKMMSIITAFGLIAAIWSSKWSKSKAMTETRPKSCKLKYHKCCPPWANTWIIKQPGTTFEAISHQSGSNLSLASITTLLKCPSLKPLLAQFLSF
jgi:hypothetical protein